MPDGYRTSLREQLQARLIDVLSYTYVPHKFDNI